MTDKELLLIDLSGRTPYGVMVEFTPRKTPRKGIVIYVKPKDENVIFKEQDTNIHYAYPVSSVKPYLRPMSSMTEEEEKEWWDTFDGKNYVVTGHSASIDWLNAHHFDYRGLIEKGLALEAPEGMYKPAM